MRTDYKKYLKIDPTTKAKKLFVELPTIIKERCFLQQVYLCAFTFLSPECSLSKTTIGRYCSVGSQVTVLSSHPTTLLTTHTLSYDDKLDTGVPRHMDFPHYSGFTTIGHDVWIGARCQIRSGINIGTGAIIGAGSLVTKDVEPYTIVGGVPARFIKRRFDQQLSAALLKSNWWWNDIYDLDLDFSDPSDCLSQLKQMGEGLEDYREYTFKQLEVVAGEMRMSKQHFMTENFHETTQEALLRN